MIIVIRLISLIQLISVGLDGESDNQRAHSVGTGHEGKMRLNGISSIVCRCRK